MSGWTKLLRHVLTLEPKQFDTFVRAIDKPVQPDQKLKALMKRRPVWERMD